MDMVDPIPDPLSSEGHSSLCEFLKSAMVHCNLMDEAFSIIQAVHKDSMDTWTSTP